MGPTNAPHSFQVLRVAHAPSPLLSLAQARAVFFERALRHGPPILLHLLHVQWKETAATSWLQQFAVDIQAVAVYVPAVRLLTDQPCPVEALCEVLQQEPRWWKAQIRAAIQAYHKELEVWYSQPPPAGADLAPSNMPRPFVCPHCQASFELRKHLRVHLARSHGYLSPVRHFVTGPYCGACMRWYHTTARVHNHLRHSKACLMRLLHTMRPLRNEEIREVEAQDASTRRKVHKGTWRAYQASLPHVPFLRAQDADLHRGDIRARRGRSRSSPDCSVTSTPSTRCDVAGGVLQLGLRRRPVQAVGRFLAYQAIHASAPWYGQHRRFTPFLRVANFGSRSTELCRPNRIPNTEYYFGGSFLL